MDEVVGKKKKRKRNKKKRTHRRPILPSQLSVSDVQLPQTSDNAAGRPSRSLPPLERMIVPDLSGIIAILWDVSTAGIAPF